MSKTYATKSIGIVVPIYNVAQYLKQCLDSILAQTYQNFYVVLVNDGSTDNSLAIAQEYVAKDSRFLLFDKLNGGQSSARNVGIEFFTHTYQYHKTQECTQSFGGGGIAYTESCITQYSIKDYNPYVISAVYTNASWTIHKIPHIDYIIFLDSDDYWVDTCLQECVEAIGDSQAVWFDYQSVFAQGIESRVLRTHLQIFGYESLHRISNRDWVHRALERHIGFCAISAWSVLFDFHFLLHKI